MTLANLSTEITTQDQVDDSKRTVLNANHLIFMRNKKFRTYFGNLGQNE